MAQLYYGPQGPTGVPGIGGQDGFQGPRGVRGGTGNTGIAGPTGVQGSRSAYVQAIGNNGYAVTSSPKLAEFGSALASPTLATGMSTSITGVLYDASGNADKFDVPLTVDTSFVTIPAGNYYIHAYAPHAGRVSQGFLALAEYNGSSFSNVAYGILTSGTVLVPPGVPTDRRSGSLHLQTIYSTSTPKILSLRNYAIVSSNNLPYSASDVKLTFTKLA